MRILSALGTLSVFAGLAFIFLDVRKIQINIGTAAVALIALFFIIYFCFPTDTEKMDPQPGTSAEQSVPDASDDSSPPYDAGERDPSGDEDSTSSDEGLTPSGSSTPPAGGNTAASGTEIPIQGVLNTVTDSISSTDQVNRYWFIAKQSGRYRVEVSDLDPDVEVDIVLYNAAGNKLAGTSYGTGNGGGITVDGLTAGQRYQVEVLQYSKFSEYTLSIGAQTATADVSGRAQVAGHIEHRDQIIKYTYTPAISGRHRFEISDLDPETKVDIILYNQAGNKIAGTSYGTGNGGGITVDDLTANEQYEIQVSYYSKYSQYTLAIGSPTATKNISGLDQVSGNIEYRDQIIKYTYTPAISGRYRFEVLDLDPEAKVDVAIYNTGGNKLAGTSYGTGNGGGITVDDLTAGQQYEIRVSYYSKYSEYTLSIGAQTATADITGWSQVEDSIDYRDQIVKYTYTPAISGRYRFEISGLDPDVKVNVAIYNATGNKISGTSYGTENGGGITVDGLNAGQKYELRVSYYNKYSKYILSIGAQTATIDLSGSSQAWGCIEYRDQIVKYAYTPVFPGTYRVEISELDPDAKVNVAIYNAAGNKLAGTSYGAGNGGGITVDDLTANERYEIQVSYYSKYSEYLLEIWPE